MRLELILANSKAFKGIQEEPLKDQIDGFCRWLDKQGYSNFAIRDHIAHISYFNTYIKQCNIKKDLSLSVPTLRTYKLSRIPYGTALATPTTQ